MFSKPPTTVVGPGTPVLHDKAITQQLAWEIELGVIIGMTAKGVERAKALQHVFGYTAIINISARDCRRAGQWIRSEEHTSELQSLMRISYAVFCLKKNTNKIYK